MVNYTASFTNPLYDCFDTKAHHGGPDNYQAPLISQEVHLNLQKMKLGELKMKEDCLNDMKVSLAQKNQFRVRREEITEKVRRIEEKIKGLPGEATEQMKDPGSRRFKLNEKLE